MLLLIPTGEPTIPLRKPEQDRRRLRETLPILFKDGYLPHLIDGRAPLRRPSDATNEIRPDGLECLTTEGQHQRYFVAVSRLWEVVQAIGGQSLPPARRQSGGSI